jgi:hypothetical protein
VEYFRGILGMTPEQRECALAGKPPAERKVILEKVREYEALPPDVREARLRQTDLHWHLITLMRIGPKERAEHLKQISPLDMPMVMSQLHQWDELPDGTRRALLANAIHRDLRGMAGEFARGPSADFEQAIGKSSGVFCE